MDLKYSTPSKFNPAPYGEVIKVIGDTSNEMVSYTYYIQTSEDTQHPLWIEIGLFLETIYEPKLHDKVWLKDKLIVYKYAQVNRADPSIMNKKEGNV